MPKALYHAVVRGWLTDEAVLDYPLVKSWIRSPINLLVTIKSPSLRSRTIAEWRPSKCRWRPDVIRQRAMLVELEPKTGRKHQLRRHLSHLLSPIIGDSKHGDLRQNRSAAGIFR